ncbi:MAG: DUF2637 domain-containing protein [Acidimicrobiales bacterium]
MTDDTRPDMVRVRFLTAADRQAAARETYERRLIEGSHLTGAALGEIFERSARWGQDRIAEVLRDHGIHTNGNRPVRTAGDDDQEDPVNGTPRPASPAVTPAIRRITTLSVLAVAAVAAVASYDHQRQLAELAGEGWRSWLLPISVDGLIVAASMTLLVRRRASQPTSALAWAALLLGGAASVVANVAAADPTLAGRLVAAWPPVALLVSYELLLSVSHRDTPAPTCAVSVDADDARI